MTDEEVQIFDVLDLEAKRVLRQLGSDSEVVLLVGSKISEWHPSNVPSGINTTRQVARLLASQFPDRGSWSNIEGYIRRAPFEYLMDKCPRKEQLRRILAREFDISTPNSAHKSIASLVNTGTFRSVVSPNYDGCLEALLPNGSPLKHIVGRRDADQLSKDSRILFKIHGSAKNGLSDSMVITLSEEAVLPDWKQQVLSQCLGGRKLLVMGFSGLDFEISPHLLASGYEMVVWTCYRNPLEDSNALTPNARRIVKSSDSVIIWGDLRHILAELDNPFVWNHPSIASDNVAQEISSQLSRTDLWVWAASVLSSPGYAKYAEEIAIRIVSHSTKGSHEYATGLFLRGDALHSKGMYFQTAKDTKEASELLLGYDDTKGYVQSEAKGIDALRSSGRIGAAFDRLARSRQTYSKSARGQPRYLAAKLDLQEVLIIREQYSRAGIWRRLGVPKQEARMLMLQSRARDLLRNVLNLAEMEGQWHDIQQCRMWARRLQIPFAEVYSGPLKPLDNLLGWHHLGHVVPEMMSLRGSLGEMNYEEASEKTVRDHISIAEEIGCDPEVWKLTLSLWRHYGWKIWDPQLKWLLAFARCQYTPSMRVFKLAVEGYR